ncbi:MAG TPA: EAL domain-containing protein [Gammaproteobacteria bacterium]
MRRHFPRRKIPAALPVRTRLLRLRRADFATLPPDAVLDAVTDAVIILDRAGRIRYCNRVARNLLQLDTHSSGTRFDDCAQLHTDDDANAPRIAVLANRRHSWRLPDSAVLVRADGSLVAVEGECLAQRHAGLPAQMLLVLRDVSEQRRARRWLAFQATHDNLTTLLNRAEIERRIAAAIAATANGARSALLYIDLDQFKIINDTRGHHAGDEFLRLAGKALREQLVRGEALARLGGDEFAVLIHDAAPGQAWALSERLIAAIHDIRFAWEQGVFRVSASIGIVEIDQRFADWKQVLSLADSACYMAKEHGRARAWIAREDDDLLRRRQAEMNWVARITTALEENRFALYRQQIAPLYARDKRAHWEVLARLREGDRPLAKPESFIPAAERYGLMPAVDRWVINSVVHHLGELSIGHRDRDGVTAINISGTTLSDGDLVPFISSRFRRYGIDPTRICFEITETAAATDFDAALRFIVGVRALGCRISLDDFGSGISSFSYLKAFDIDYLKIDGGFVRDMDSDETNARFVESINHLGKSLGLTTIAEYVESAPVVECLLDLGVDYAQGNFLGRPQQWIA